MATILYASIHISVSSNKFLNTKCPKIIINVSVLTTVTLQLCSTVVKPLMRDKIFQDNTYYDPALPTVLYGDKPDNFLTMCTCYFSYFTTKTGVQGERSKEGSLPRAGLKDRQDR